MSQLLVDDIVDKDGGNSVGFSKGINVSASSTITGNLNVTGVLTYEDVTNVDAVGLITARSGIKFGVAGVGGTIRANGDTTLAGVVTATSFSGDGSALTGMANTANVSTSGLNVVGVATIGGDASIADKIIHTGDTNTAIRFPSADTISFETSGGEQLRVSSGGQILGGLTTPYSTVLSSQTPKIQLESTSVSGSSMFLLRDGADTGGPFLFLGHGRGGATIVQDGDELGNITFVGADGTNFQNAAAIKSLVDGTPGSGTDMPGSLSFWTSPDGSTTLAERLKIKSSGDVTIGSGVTISSAGICTITTGTDLNGYKVESGDVSGGTLNGEFDFELQKGHIKRVTGATGGNYFPDFKVSSSVSLNSIMDVGDTITATLIVASSSHYCTTGIKIDNSTSNIDLDWVGGSAPSAANGSGVDIYGFTIIKTAATPAYHIIGNAMGAA